MKNTKLLYLNDFTLVNCEAHVSEIIQENDKDVVILDQTVFYPQGGGQPYDQGVIETPNAQFKVLEVRMIDEIVKHIGQFNAAHFKISETVVCHVDQERRIFHNRLHSAGHLVDLAIQKLNLGWIPGKGHHFPSGPFVEYAGSLENIDKEKLTKDIETICDQIIKTGMQTEIKFVTKPEVKNYCQFVPDYLSNDKPIRLILFGDFAVPCGGTHVQDLQEIRGMKIRKIKQERGQIKVGYDVVA